MPTVPDPTYRAQINWKTESGAEIAVTTIMGTSPAGAAPPSWGGTMQDLCDAMVPGVAAGMAAGLAARVTSSAYIDSLEVYRLGQADGHATDKGTHTYAPTDLPGTSTSPMLPPILTPILQLWGYPPAGFVANARRHRGRLYLPGVTASAFQGDGSISGGYATDVVAGFKAMLNAWNSIDTANGKWLSTVYSRRNQLHYGIVDLSVATWAGVQHRRQNALVSGHTAPVAL